MSITSNTELIINFSRKLWNSYFPENTSAPTTLIYDPQCLCPSIYSGFCHIAHDYMSEQNPFPDQEIYMIDYKFKSQESILHFIDSNSYINSIDTLPRIHYLVLGSDNNTKEVSQLVSKIDNNGLIIVLNASNELQTDINLIEIDDTFIRDFRKNITSQNYSGPTLKNVRVYKAIRSSSF